MDSGVIPWRSNGSPRKLNCDSIKHIDEQDEYVLCYAVEHLRLLRVSSDSLMQGDRIREIVQQIPI